MLNKLIIIAGLDSNEMIKFAYEKSYEFDDSWILQFPENSKHPSKVKNDLKFYVQDECNLIVCSHADYVLTYLRVLIRQKIIDYKNVEIWWLDRQPIQLKIYESSGIDPYPKGFFNSTEDDLMQLF